jgi:hypothetical protein
MDAAARTPTLFQVQLGHTSIDVTLNTYGYLFPDAFNDLGEALDQLVQSSGNPAWPGDEGSRGPRAAHGRRLGVRDDAR